MLQSQNNNQKMISIISKKFKYDVQFVPFNVLVSKFFSAKRITLQTFFRKSRKQGKIIEQT